MPRALVALVALVPGTAHATYSIVATDTARREVGGAGTSCVGTLSVTVIYGSVPGKGAVHAQAQLGGPGKAAAVMQLGMDIAPADIIASITSTQFDPNAQQRQYGIVDLMARSAGFSGALTAAYSDDRQHAIGTFTYSVQGNILTSAAVLDQASVAFELSGCDLADRLMLALEAGAHGGQGDSRCTPDGIPSDSAFLEVDRDGEAAGSFLRLDVTNTAPQNPLVLLRAQYDAWRTQHACPMPSSPDAGALGDAGPVTGEQASGCCSSARDLGSFPVAVALVILVRRRSRCIRRRCE
jgi:uncharacterized Ntn-hydrolase superfamily protein